jgi:prepilin-type N-terminal cleavage/methylation domain-containing protein
MSIRKPEDNLWFHVYRLCAGFVSSLANALVMVFDSAFRKEKRKKMPSNHFLSSLHFLLHEFPKSFWKFPTGIGIGRSVGTVLLYFFGNRRYFTEASEAPTASQKAKNSKRSGFTLIEMVISITLFSGILLAAFSAFGNIAHFKNKIVSDVDVYEQLYVSVEQLTTIIKDGGDIDYEEYFNRSVLGTSLS